MSPTQVSDFCRLWRTSTWEWRSLFLQRLNDEDLADMLAALKVESAVQLVAKMREGHADKA